MTGMSLFPILNFPLIHPGDDLAALIVAHLEAQGEKLQSGDILVLAQKIVSKAEGRLVRLNEVVPSAEAQEIADVVGKEPRHIQVILDDSRGIVRAQRGLFVVEQRSGWICANAGVDRSNIDPEQGETLALLPLDADASAVALAARLGELTGVTPAIIINDSHGRAWRIGTCGVAIGCAGLPPVWNQRGLRDLFGYELHSSEECIADELAAAASLLMGQSSEGRPVVVIRGYQLPPASPAPATSIQRPAHMDAFR
jgi:coenzyme F420-0:L-glutamate ligase/coenzyme F420-1:gamma-L-glutamate ligase